jgi:hypothetical protein
MTRLILLLLLEGFVSVANGQSTSARQRGWLPLEVLPDTLAICRLPADAPVPVTSL